MTSDESIKKKFRHEKLCLYERVFYWIVWLFSISYPFYRGYKLSRKHSEEIKEDLTLSWNGTFFKDSMDSEWDFWSKNTSQLALIFTVSSGLIRLIKCFIEKPYQNALILTSILLLQALVLSIKGLLLVVVYIAICYFVSLFKRGWMTWSLSLLTIVAIHFWDIKINILKELLAIRDEHTPLLELALMMAVLRNISFATFITQQDVSGNEAVSFVHFLSYVLYVPLCYNGPILTFDIFRRDLYVHRRKNFPLCEILMDALKTLANFLTLEVFLRFVYAHALSIYHWILEEMTPVEAIAMFWIHLHIFNIKYFIFYRFSGVFAKLDGIEPPGPPKCIASLYTYVDMWRYFDKGLNRFLLQTIYVPLGGSKKGFVRKTLASFACFTFIGLWHGADKSLMAWALTNWMGIVFESVATFLVKTQLYQKARVVFGELAHRRLCAFGGAFSVFTLIYTNMIFLVGFDSATILLKRIFVVWYWPPLCLFVFYCGNHCSIDVSYI